MKKLILVITFLLFSSTAWATLIDNDTFTTDTDTGLDWLDLTPTINLSFSDVQLELGEGGQFEGWRYATGMEIVDFWTNLGIPDIDTAYSEANYLPVLTLIDLVGYTGGGGGELEFSFAMSADIASPTEVFSLWAQVNEGAFNPPRARARTGAVTLMNEPKSDIASWLVRPSTPIPEPSTMLLLGTGLVGLAGVSARRRFKKVRKE